METRWGTFTDPWTHQPQPTCGFTFVGSDGTIASPDYASHVTVQTRARPERHEIPVDPLKEGERNAIEYVLGCIARGEKVGGPLDPRSASRRSASSTPPRNRPPRNARWS
jgi:hypothetical protein